MDEKQLLVSSLIQGTFAGNAHARLCVAQWHHLYHQSRHRHEI